MTKKVWKPERKKKKKPKVKAFTEREKREIKSDIYKILAWMVAEKNGL